MPIKGGEGERPNLCGYHSTHFDLHVLVASCLVYIPESMYSYLHVGGGAHLHTHPHSLDHTQLHVCSSHPG